MGKFLSPKIKIPVLVMINEDVRTGASANVVAAKQELDSDDDDVTLGMMRIKAKKMKLEIQRHLKKQALEIGGTGNNEASKKEKKKAVKRELEREKERDRELTLSRRDAAINSGRGGKGVVTDWSLLLETDKGLLTNRLLSRWWYVYNWPNMDIIDPPPQYLALQGFPGGYICVEGDKIGHIMDNRSRDDCPCFARFAKMRAKDLIEKLELAYKNQLMELQKHWGEGSKEEIRIRKERKWLKNVRFPSALCLSILYTTLCFSIQQLLFIPMHYLTFHRFCS